MILKNISGTQCLILILGDKELEIYSTEAKSLERGWTQTKAPWNLGRQRQVREWCLREAGKKICVVLRGQQNSHEHHRRKQGRERASRSRTVVLRKDGIRRQGPSYCTIMNGPWEMEKKSVTLWFSHQNNSRPLSPPVLTHVASRAASLRGHWAPSSGPGETGCRKPGPVWGLQPALPGVQAP